MDYTGDELQKMFDRGMSYQEISESTGLAREAVRSRMRRAQKRQPTAPRLQASPYPQYNAPLEMAGDALILFDTEFPFHEADFMNRCLDLAQAWNIRQCIIGGDVLHFDMFSQWEANWISVQRANSITEDKEAELRARIQALPVEQQGPLMDWLQSVTIGEQEQTELGAAKHALLTLGKLFDRIDYVLGNHDDRFIRALKSPLMPQSLLDFLALNNPAWRIAPYFFSVLNSAGQVFRIEHPRSASVNTAVRLADKFDCHVIVGHSHLQSTMWSTSGKHWAIHAGASVDETRLAYAAQRASNRPAHSLGAVIVRDGYPWVLSPVSPWEQLEKCK